MHVVYRDISQLAQCSLVISRDGDNERICGIERDDAENREITLYSRNLVHPFTRARMYSIYSHGGMSSVWYRTLNKASLQLYTVHLHLHNTASYIHVCGHGFLFSAGKGGQWRRRRRRRWSDASCWASRVSISTKVCPDVGVS